MTTIELWAPAKLTVTLAVTGVRDDGYHLLDAEMVSLNLYDRLRLAPGATGLIVRATGAADGLLAADDDPAENLVARALRLAGVEAGVELTKSIPTGAGLGGGSADAAAVLRWAGFDDLVSASTIGADVPFCLVGGRARVRGVGEQVEPLPPRGRTYTVVTPPVHCSTPAVYAMWDEMGGPRGPGSNDLEPAALKVAPELAAVRERLGEATGRTPSLAGSGSSWFVEGSYPEAGMVLRELTRAEIATGPSLGSDRGDTRPTG